MTDLTVANGTNIDFFIIATITSKNGGVTGLTSLESVFTWQNISYNPGLDFASFANTMLNSTDNSTYQLTILSSNNISNLFGATIELSFGSQNSTTNIYSFFLGNILSATFTPKNIVLKLAPIAYNLKCGIGEYFSQNCRAEFGDTKCQINISAFTFNGQITSVNGRLLAGNHSPQKVGYFVNGVINFTNRVSFRVLDDSAGILIATVPNLPINTGDEYNIVAGCNKSFSMCLNNFNNIINFRGEPFINN